MAALSEAIKGFDREVAGFAGNGRDGDLGESKEPFDNFFRRFYISTKSACDG